MQELPLINAANQSFDVTLDAGQFSIAIREANGVMIADVALNGVAVVSGQPCLAGEPIIPYAYLQDGNFVFSTLNDDLPYWDQFGITQALYYLTDAEMA